MLVREELRDYGPRSSFAAVMRPATIDEAREMLAWAARERRNVTIRGQGQSYDGESLGDDVVLATTRLTGVLSLTRDRVTLLAGTTWRELLTALAKQGRYPPVVPSWVEASVGGTLASPRGGIGKGSIQHGVVRDHVESVVSLDAGGATRLIAEVTLRLQDRPRFVRRSTCEVSREDLAATLSESSLAHASAVLVGPRTFRAYLTHHVPEGAPTSEHLLPPRAEVERPCLVESRTLDAAGLAALDPAFGRTVRVHPFLSEGKMTFLVHTSSHAR